MNDNNNYIYKKLSDGRYIKEVDNNIEHLASVEEDAKLATDIRSLLKGDRGLDGSSGSSGQDGTSGRDGKEGKIGRTGLTGPRGFNGTSGSSGSSGQDGTSGRDGEKGEKGDRGFKGDKGDRGERGFPGLQGPAGRDGTSGGGEGGSGTSGSNGSSGSSGLSGTSGVSGLLNFTSRNNIIIGTPTASSLPNYISNAFGTLTTSTQVPNYTYVAPISFSKSFTFSSITLSLGGNSGINTATFSFALYTDNGNDYPSTLIFSSSDYPSTTGLKQHIVSGTISAGNKYWVATRLVYLNNTTSFTIQSINPSVSSVISIGNTSATNWLLYFAYRSALNAGFPSSWSAGQLYAFASVYTPIVGFL